MQAKNILKADMLDILFENRNKSYGAYDLRKTYNKRLLTAMTFMSAVCLLFFLSNLFAGGRKTTTMEVGPPIILASVPDPPKKEEPVPEEPAAAAPKAASAKIEQVRVEQFVKPEIVANDQVNPDNAVKEMAVLETAQIGKVSMDGADAVGLSAPVLPEGTGTGKGVSISGHGNTGVEEGIMVTVQIEARFPGGTDAWRKFLERSLNRDAPMENGALSGSKLTVLVSFIVDKDGNLSEVRAENDPGYGTAEEAVRVIKKGPKWIPAIQNGRNVIYRQRQSITFLVEEN